MSALSREFQLFLVEFYGIHIFFVFRRSNQLLAPPIACGVRKKCWGKLQDQKFFFQYCNTLGEQFSSLVLQHFPNAAMLSWRVQGGGYGRKPRRLRRCEHATGTGRSGSAAPSHSRGVMAGTSGSLPRCATLPRRDGEPACPTSLSPPAPERFGGVARL